MTSTGELYARISALSKLGDDAIRLKAEGLISRTVLDQVIAEIGRRCTAAKAALEPDGPDDGGFLFARTPSVRVHDGLGGAGGSTAGQMTATGGGGEYAAAEARPAQTYSATVGQAADADEFVLDVLSAGDRLAELVTPATLDGQRAAQHWKTASSLLRTHRAGE